MTLFFLAFLPQFAVPERGRVVWQVVLLGVVFMLMTAMSFSMLGDFAGSIGHWIVRHRTFGRWFNRLAALVLVVLGMRLALLERF